MDIEDLRNNLVLQSLRRRRNNVFSYFLRHVVYGNAVRDYEISTTNYERWQSGEYYIKSNCFSVEYLQYVL